jgi:hypothetical protein
VLDGKQRLVAIRDFANGELTVDGEVEPIDPGLKEIHGLTYSRLPDFWRRRFDNFSIRMFRIVEYQPSEPGELFYRLNQPTKLTTAEQRNAFYGPARKEVKELVKALDTKEDMEQLLGFSNARMSWDDVVSRVCLTLERGTLHVRVTAADMADRYRSPEGFSSAALTRTKSALQRLADALQAIEQRPRLNKATMSSWLLFLAELGPAEQGQPVDVPGFISYFEARRQGARDGTNSALLAMFNDRASSRVADVSSVVLRDFVLWHTFLSGEWPSAVIRNSSTARKHSALSGSLPKEGADYLAREEWLTKKLMTSEWGSAV